VDTWTLTSVELEMGVHVPRTRPPYPPEFRAEAVRLLRATGRTPQQVADDLGVSRQSVANWARQADRDDGLRDDGLTTAERDELRRLRREVRDLREERDILKKAAAFFASMRA
jgi:transposase